MLDFFGVNFYALLTVGLNCVKKFGRIDVVLFHFGVCVVQHILAHGSLFGEYPRRLEFHEAEHGVARVDNRIGVVVGVDDVVGAAVFGQRVAEDVEWKDDGEFVWLGRVLNVSVSIDRGHFAAAGATVADSDARGIHESVCGSDARHLILEKDGKSLYLVPCTHIL